MRISNIGSFALSGYIMLTNRIKHQVFEDFGELSFLHSRASVLSSILDNHKVAIMHSNLAFDYSILAHGDEHPVTIMRHEENGDAHRAESMHLGAMDSYIKALMLTSKVYGETSFITARQHLNIGITYLSLQKPESALNHFKKCLEINRLNLKKVRFYLADYINEINIETHLQYARAYSMLGDLKKANHHKCAAEHARKTIWNNTNCNKQNH